MHEEPEEPPKSLGNAFFFFFSVFVWETNSPLCARISDLWYLHYVVLSSSVSTIIHSFFKPQSFISTEIVLYMVGTLSALTLCLWKLIRFQSDYLLLNKSPLTDLLFPHTQPSSKPSLTSIKPLLKCQAALLIEVTGCFLTHYINEASSHMNTC